MLFKLFLSLSETKMHKKERVKGRRKIMHRKIKLNNILFSHLGRNLGLHLQIYYIYKHSKINKVK